MPGTDWRPMAANAKTPRVSVRARTTVAAVVVLGVTLGLASFVMLSFVERSLEAQVADEADLRASQVAETGVTSGSVAVAEPTEEFVQVLVDGRVEASSANVAGSEPLALPAGEQQVILDEVPFTPGAFIVVAAPTHDPPGGIVVVGRNIDDVRDARHIVSVALVIGIPFVLAVAGALVWWLVGRALRPVGEIGAEVDRITTGELDRRVPQPAGHDEIARLAATMNRMLNRLEAGVERQRRFASDASHELRSPVASIRQQVEVARAHPDAIDQAAVLGVIAAEDARLEALVEDLLLLARIDEGAPVAVREVDVDDLLMRQANHLREAGGVVVDTSGVGAARTRGDVGQLARAIRNLSDNAARHARTTVAFASHTDVAGVLVTIEDDGSGVAEEDRGRAFERFVRLDGARDRDTGGAGLGLAIVRDVVRAHGGEVELTSSHLGGARVEMRLPAG